MSSTTVTTSRETEPLPRYRLLPTQSGWECAYDVQIAAMACELSESTILRAIRSGSLPATLRCGRFLMHHADLRAWLKRRA